ncbi:amidohydrolase family protein [Amycolatopsis pithecellobii]|uniref:Amidohydrolase family protein n=1 Tax=Amycolatopsis pithecellobii TaxID=664692 RepID=A0A6N7Z6Z8_9PSEU|nr:amidohydrolase family protein [Amycolatopsis pithecellobii]MTD55486.1 amidohydrolase family protein [Amycolatopsis pithecellobii]
MFDGYKVLDIHSHLSAPPEHHSFLAMLLGSNTAMPSPYSHTQLDTIAGPGVIDEDRLAASFARHIAYLDDRDIDVQLLGPRPFTVNGWMAPHLIPTWARYVNDLIHLQVQAYPGRFVGACQLPQVAGAPDAAHVLPELERCVSKLGFAAAYASPDPSGDRRTPGMHEPWWFPLYEACEDLDIPIIVHGTGSKDARFAVVPHNYQLGFLVEQYLAVQFLEHSDVFTRFPRLRIVVCHCGGALNRFVPTDPHRGQTDLSDNLFFDTCGYDPVFLEAAIKQRGADRMLFGTEAPGSGRAVRPETGRTSDDLVPVIGREFGWLDAAERRAIFHDNPARVCPALVKAA